MVITLYQPSQRILFDKPSCEWCKWMWAETIIWSSNYEMVLYLQRPNPQRGLEILERWMDSRCEFFLWGVEGSLGDDRPLDFASRSSREPGPSRLYPWHPVAWHVVLVSFCGNVSISCQWCCCCWSASKLLWGLRVQTAVADRFHRFHTVWPLGGWLNHDNHGSIPRSLFLATWGERCSCSLRQKPVPCLLRQEKIAQFIFIQLFHFLETWVWSGATPNLQHFLSTAKHDDIEHHHYHYPFLSILLSVSLSFVSSLHICMDTILVPLFCMFLCFLSS